MLVGGVGDVPAEPQWEPARVRLVPPEVKVSQPVAREVSDYADFTGRTEAAESVSVRARVTGYLVKMPFKEGSAVKKGDLLFEIDPRPYQAQLDQAQAQVGIAQATLKLREATYERVRTLAAAGNATRQEVDEATAGLEEAKARIKAAQAAVEIYKLNLEFCKVTSPIDGTVGRYHFTAGNLVIQDETLLTTVVSKDPMYAYFDMDERTFLNLRQAIRDGKIKEKPTELPVAVGLANEDGFPHKGKIDFVDNQVDPKTGTIRLRVVLPNGDGQYVPGLFVRVRLTTSDPYKALLVWEDAVCFRAGRKFVYVVNDKDVIEVRWLTSGPRQDEFVIVKEGLKPGDRVVIDTRVVDEGMTVKPVKVDDPAAPKERREKPQK